MTRDEVCHKIREIGIVPSVRVGSAADALFAANTVIAGGIPVVEITMTVPGAMTVIAALREQHPEAIIGAGTVLTAAGARRCLDAGAMFVTSPGLDVEIVEVTRAREVAAIPGALTPSEVMRAMAAGADMIKIFPCAQVGGAEYIRALRPSFPDVPLIASGGVHQQTAEQFILAGASALGIGEDLIPHAAIHARKEDWIRELAHRFLTMVQRARGPKS